MVVYYESYPPMFPTPTNRHHQNFGHYASYNQQAISSGHSQFTQEMPMTQFSTMDNGGSWAPNAYAPPSSCSRTPAFDEWSPRSPCAHLPHTQNAAACVSPVGFNAAASYKIVPDFSQPPPPAQDLSVHGGGQHSPDSGLTVSSDGVSSSDSPGTNNNHVLAGSHHGNPAQHGQLRPPIIRSPFDWMKKPSYQTQCNPGKTRTKDKYRVVYSDIQRLELEKEFHYSRYITIRRKAELAQLLGLSERQVKIWFQNRRAKERKQVKKREELVQKEKDIVVHHHLQPLQMATPNGLPNKMVTLD